MSSPHPEESSDILRFAERLEILRHLEEHRDGVHWSLASEGSELAQDDELTKPFQTSHLVGFCLSQSLDMFRTIRAIVIDPNDPTELRMPMAGLYPIIRGALEAASLAYWVLRPDDAATRLERSLRARWTDIVQDRQMVLTFTENAPGDAPAKQRERNNMRQKYAKVNGEEKRHLIKVAATAGVELERMQRPLSFEDVVGFAGHETVGRGRQAAMWRLLSGLSHPSVSRSTRFSRLEEKRDVGDGTFEALISIRIDTALVALEAAILTHLRTLDFAARRGDDPGLRFGLSRQDAEAMFRQYRR
jgi:hypothetical protein